MTNPRRPRRAARATGGGSTLALFVVALPLTTLALFAASGAARAASTDQQTQTGLPARLTVEEAVSWAVAHNPRLAAGRKRAQAAGEQASGQSRRLLPSVRLSEEAQLYDSAYTFGTFPIRDQFTNTFVASVNQPLLGLLHLNEERQAAGEASTAAWAQSAANEADLRQMVATQFLRYFEAGALKSIAESSSHELEEQIVVAKARFAQGVITQADLLRLQVAAANSQQQAIQAESQIVTSRAMVFGLLGTSDDGRVTLVEPTQLLNAAPTAGSGTTTAEPERNGLLTQGQAHRPELQQSLHLIEVAEHQRSARTFALLPEIDLEAAYLRTDGQKFAPPNSAFVGVKAQWAIWEWGASNQLRRAALLQSDAAREDAEAWRRQIETEIVSQLSQAQVARGAMQAADAAMASAEEAYRVTNAQLKSGTATTTDLLQAEAALTQARLNQTRSRYELALAHVALKRATGE